MQVPCDFFSIERAERLILNGSISWWRHQVHCTRNQAACFVPLGPMPMLLGRTDTAHSRSQSAALLPWVRKWNRPPICFFFSLISTERAVETFLGKNTPRVHFWYKRGLFLGIYTTSQSHFLRAGMKIHKTAGDKPLFGNCNHRLDVCKKRL